MNSFFDVVIVGAGPSGLMAAYELSSKTKCSICLVDMGNEVSARDCGLVTFDKCQSCEVCNVVHGFAGAGLFSDGKLCLSNKVGERLGEITNKFTPELVRTVDQFLGVQAQGKQGSANQIDRMTKIADKAGLCLELYPVKAIPHKKSVGFLTSLQREIHGQRVAVYANTHVSEFHKLPSGEWQIIAEKQNKPFILRSSFLLIGTGKSGSRWLIDQLSKIGVETKPTPFYFGVRVETTKEIMKNVMNLSHNPKFFSRTDSFYIKSHCFAEGGQVLAYTYDDIRIAGGFTDDSKNTSFSVLVKYCTPPPFRTVDYSRWMCKLMNQLGQNKVIIQKLGDFKKGRASTKANVENNIVSPTMKDYSLYDLSSFFGENIRFLILDFIKKLDCLSPGVDMDSTLVYGPASEWVIDRISLNNDMETAIENLYVIGDGSGATQGIVAAASTGIIAAQSIAGKISNSSNLSDPAYSKFLESQQ